MTRTELPDAVDMPTFMKEMPEHAKREVASCLRDLADGDLQVRTWLQAEPGGPASPAELVSQLFDDTALGDYLSSTGQRPIFSSSIDALLIRISALVDELDLGTPPRLLLRKPQWQEARRTAAEAAALIDELSRE